MFSSNSRRASTVSAAAEAPELPADNRADVQPAADMKSTSSRPNDPLVDDIDPSEKVSDMLTVDAWLGDWVR
jgi:hypothetical protein